jgi:hypothetical protein
MGNYMPYCYGGMDLAQQQHPAIYQQNQVGYVQHPQYLPPFDYHSGDNL